MKIVKFNSFIDDRGSLLPFEFDLFPFKPKRIFLVQDVPINCIRGNHSHHTTKQFIICLAGKIEVILHDGNSEIIFTLNKNEGLLIPEMIWDSQKFLENNSVLLVLCSTKYDENDYILDFENFQNIKKNEKSSNNGY